MTDRTTIGELPFSVEISLKVLPKLLEGDKLPVEEIVIEGIIIIEEDFHKVRFENATILENFK